MFRSLEKVQCLAYYFLLENVFRNIFPKKPIFLSFDKHPLDCAQGHHRPPGLTEVNRPDQLKSRRACRNYDPDRGVTGSTSHLTAPQHEEGGMLGIQSRGLAC